MSTKRRTPGVFSSPPPKNEKGEKLCRNCRKVIPKNKHNCSRKCSEEWALKTCPRLMRRAVFARDKGICGRCGADTEAIQSSYRAARKPHGTEYCIPMEKLRKELGITGSCEPLHWWEADHIIPVVEGGGECGLEGYRTLCIPCHRKATKELRARMARRLRDEKALERDRQGLFADQVEA
jgi:5-methylcytosine-specific restriction enzyme A